jgi:uncharacterized membrane protein required for colicin V production
LRIVNALDLAIAVLLVSAVVGGYRMGMIARLASWIGAVGGFYLGLRLLPTILSRVGEMTPLTRLIVTLGTLLLGAALGGSLGEMAGATLRRVLAPGPVRVLDRLGGSLLGVFGVLVGLWLFLPMAADVPGSAARLVRNSAILGAIQDMAPRPPDAAQAVSRLVGADRFPDVFEDLRPAPDTGPPPSEVPVPSEVVRKAVASSVNVESEGCGGIHEGSGFAVAPNTIVTNAHVVAGGTRIRVRRPDQKLITARVVMFDDNRDLAILDAPGLGQEPLAIGDGKAAVQGAVIGYPGGQNTPRVAPAVVRQQILAIGRDIYNRDRTQRQVLVLAAQLRQGDSGSAFIDSQGRVAGVSFAIAPDRPGTAYALDDSELKAALAAPRGSGPGPCI